MSTAGGGYDTVIRLSCVDGVGPVLATLAARCMGLDRTFKELGTSMKLTLGGRRAVPRRCRILERHVGSRQRQ
jgi:hypothetical protein